MFHLTSFSIADHIPEDLRDPFYTDQYDQEHIKPPVIRLLLSCELYCRVCALILKTEQAASLQSHLSVIQALSRKGIYVVESDDTPVTDEDLASMPIKMVSGLSGICCCPQKGWLSCVFFISVYSYLPFSNFSCYSSWNLKLVMMCKDIFSTRQVMVLH